MENGYKILIALPCFKTVLVPTMDSICKLLKNKTYDADFKPRESIYVHNNRNRLIEDAKGYDYIFFVDYDIVFPEDTIERLLKHNKQVVSGLYNYRKLPISPILYRRNQNGELYLEITEMIPKEPFKAFCAGAGCLLIKTEVFDKLPQPYFEYLVIDGKERMSEDMMFSKKLEDAGIELWVDPTIELKHIGDAIY